MQLSEARVIAEDLKSQLSSYCERIEIAGSIRRQKADVGDIELLCIPKYMVGIDQLDREIKALIAHGILDYRLNKLGSKVYGAKNKLLLHRNSGIGVDVFSTTEECWPVALVVRTGGEKSNKQIAYRALQQGMRFHAYGRGFTLSGGGELICHSEADVFEAVGLKYKEPWERE